MLRHQRTITTNPSTPLPPPGEASYAATPAPAAYAPSERPYVADTVRDVGVGRTMTRRRFMPASAAGALLGIALMIVGGVALARAGTGGDFANPVVDVLGWSHNAPLAVAELAAGFLLLVSSLSGVRGMILFFSALVTAAGIVFAIEPDAIDSFVVERAMAVVVAIAAGVVLLMAALLPTVVRSTNHVAEEVLVTD